MTKEKLQLFKDMYLKEVKHTIDPNRKATRGEYIRIVLDSGIEFNTQTDFVIFDDDNELLHIICANDDPLSQYDWPFKIMSAPYDIIFVIESIMSKTNLDDILNDSFLGNVINDEKKKFIRTWMDSSNTLHKPYPMDADPYYTQNPKSIPNGTKIISRDDGIKIASSPATKASGVVKAVKTKESFLDAIANAEEGAVVALAADIELTETLKLEKEITIVGAGKTITSSAKSAIEIYADASISGLNITNTYNGGRCVNIREAINLDLKDVNFSTTSTGNNQPITIGGSTNGTTVSIRNSNINSGVAGYGIIAFVESDIEIKDCEFTGYNAIYMKAGSENSDIIIENSNLEGVNNHPGEGNRFGTVVFEAGNIRLNTNATTNITSTPVNDAYHVAFLVQTGLDNVVIISNGNVTGRPILINDTNKVNNNIITLPKYCNDAIYECGFNTIADPIYKNKIRVVDYSETSVNGVAYETLADAIAAAEDGDTIEFARDVESEGAVQITKAITLNGNGKQVTGSDKKTFEIFADANISNMIIRNTANNGRCVDTRDAVNLELDNVVINSLGGANNQAITIGGSNNGASVTIKNSIVDANNSGYGIISFVESEINIEGTNINGYGGIYMKAGSEGSKINVKNSIIEGENEHTGDDDRFGTIIFEAGNIEVSVDSYSTISSYPENDAEHTAFLLNSNGIDNVVIGVDGTINGIPLYINEGTSILNNIFIISEKYKEAFWSSGFGTTESSAGYIKVADKSNTTLVNGVACETITDAIAAANVGDTVYICSDMTSSDIIKVDKAITIDGGGKIVTGSAKKTFEIYADAIITNMTIDNTSSNGRCVDTRSAVHVELDNVTMNTSSKQNNQPITIGGSENGTTLVLKNSNISAGVAGYGVIAFVKSDVTLENSKIDGYSAVYMKEGSDESYVEIANCDIVSKNPHLDPSSHFGVIAIESNNCSINVVGNTTISAEPVEGQMHEIVLLINTANMNNIVFENETTLNGDILNSSETIAENSIKLPASYADKIAENGFDYEEIDGDYIMIKAKEVA